MKTVLSTAIEYRAFGPGDLSQDEFLRLQQLVRPDGMMRHVLSGRNSPIVKPVAAWLGDVIVGWCVMYHDSFLTDDAVAVIGTFVSPDHRTAGIGQRLMQEELGLYRATDPESLEVYYDDHAPAAAAIRRQIEAAGFQAVGINACFEGNTRAPENLI